MDATENDVPSPYEVRGFPTIFFAPKNDKNNPRKYEVANDNLFPRKKDCISLTTF